MKITIARYKTPSGRIIQRPYTNGEHEEYIADQERYQRRDTANIPDSLIFSTLNLKRKVYGGGGISPDIYIPADTTIEHVFTRTVLENGIVQQVIIDLLDRMPVDEFMSRYPTFEKYEQQFSLDTESIDLMTRLVTAINPSAAKDKKGMAESTAIIEAQLAEEVFGTGLYHKMQGNKNDKVYIRSLEIIEANLFQKNKLSSKSGLME
jgi:carboxyl-terminal processing protease